MTTKSAVPYHHNCKGRAAHGLPLGAARPFLLKIYCLMWFANQTSEIHRIWRHRRDRKFYLSRKSFDNPYTGCQTQAKLRTSRKNASILLLNLVYYSIKGILGKFEQDICFRIDIFLVAIAKVCE